MIKEIQSILLSEPKLKAVYGFGSYFRSAKFADCDVLLVVEDDSPNLGLLHSNLNALFRDLSRKQGVIFDVTILTETEHSRAPLREHSQLVTLCLRTEVENPQKSSS